MLKAADQKRVSICRFKSELKRSWPTFTLPIMTLREDIKVDISSLPAHA